MLSLTVPLVQSHISLVRLWSEELTSKSKLRFITSEDYLTANDPELTIPLNESQRSDLYAELASGAETGLFRLGLSRIQSRLHSAIQVGTTLHVGCPSHLLRGMLAYAP